MAPKLDFGVSVAGGWTPSDGAIEKLDELQKLYVGGERWPICAASLAALVDLGMSDERIGDYFRVDAHRVTALRHFYMYATLRA